MLGATWSSTHLYGDCLINHSRKIYYVNIPKCASSWMKSYIEALRSTGEVWDNSIFTEEPLKEYQAMIFLRDPVKRWLSTCPGVNRMTEEYFINSLPGEFDNLKSWMHDEHSAPQVDFIAGLDLTNAIFFYCDKNLSANVNRFLNTNLTVEPQNVQPNDEKHKLGKATWQSYFDKEIYLNKFKNAYKKDYDLINQVKFYDSR
jgi:hypothetical protein